MGVYIKGMEMPEEGEYIKIHANGLAVKIIYDESKLKSVPENGLGYYAKAVPVPPHGDLIDRDALPWDKQSLMLADEDWALPCVLIDDAPTIIPADDSKLSATVKCGGAVTCAVAYSEEVYGKHIDTAGNLRWTGTHSGEHIVKAEEGET